MFIAIDIGNTTVNIGILKQGRLIRTHAFACRLPKAQLRRQLSRFFKSLGPESIAALLICSVVPPVARLVESMARKTTGEKPLLVGRDILVPIKNRYKNPRQVGQDRLVCAYAAACIYGAPVIVIDLGTAITAEVVSAKKEYLGGVIIPGLRLSAESLFQKTALLPMVEIKRPGSLIGRDTSESILSGLFYGYGQMLQGMIGLLKNKVNGRAKVVITGGYAKLMEKFIAPRVDAVEQNLVFKGLYLIWKNSEE